MLIVMKAHATEEEVRRVCEKIEISGLPRAPPAGRAAHRHRHHRQPGRGRPRQPRRAARSAGSHPRLQALQAGQPRRQDGRHRHPLRRHRRHHRRPRTGHDRRPLRDRESRTGLRHRRAGGPRRRAVLPRRRLQAAHLALRLSGAGRSRPADSGRDPRPLRPADRHRSHRQRIARRWWRNTPT